MRHVKIQFVFSTIYIYFSIFFQSTIMMKRFLLVFLCWGVLCGYVFVQRSSVYFSLNMAGLATHNRRSRKKKFVVPFFFFTLFLKQHTLFRKRINIIRNRERERRKVFFS